MAITQETQVADVANRIIALASGLVGMQTQINAVSAAVTGLNVAARLQQFPTAVLTSTGGIGAVDGTPVLANPINTGVAPGTLINRSISYNDLAGLLSYLQGIATAIGGGAVSLNAQAAALVAKTL